MPPLQENKKIRQVNPVDFLLPVMSIVLPKKLDKIKHTMVFHVDIVKKIDTLLREHEKKTMLEELVSAQQTTLLPEEPFVEMRTPLGKKTEPSIFHLKKKQDTSFYKQLTIPDEFKTDFFTTNHPSFKFVSTFDTTEDVLRIKKPEERHVEVINLSSLAADSGAVQKKIEDASKSKKDTKTMQSKKVEVIETKKLDDKKCNSATTVQQTEEDTGKAKIYYLNSKTLDEKKIKKLEKKQSHIPVDFEDKIQKLKEKEEKRLRMFETKKEKLEARQKKKEEQKALLEKRKKEAEEKKKEEQKALLEKRKKEAEEKELLMKEAAYAEEKKLESVALRKEEKRLKKLEEKQARLEARQKKKEENEAMAKTLAREAEERKQLKKKTRRGEYDELKENVLLKSVEIKQTPTFVDDDVVKVLLMTDDLLGNLPEDIIEKFAKSEDFKLYEKIISKYKAK